MDRLEKVVDLLHRPGEPMAGIDMTLEQAWRRGGLLDGLPPLPCCVVRNWIWIDLIVDDERLTAIDAAGREPVMLYGTVLLDNHQRFAPGDWVRSSLLVTFSDGCLFRTRNTLYVLVGDGERKRAEFETVLQLH